MRKPVRNYLKIINEFINLQTPFDVEILGCLHYDKCYPFISLHTHSKLAKYNIVINAGVHGNESIGVKILLRFITEFNKEFLGYYNFIIFPIMNPFGYSYIRRGNGNNQYVNDGFIKGTEDAATPETKLIIETLPNRIDLFIDIHEDEDKPGFYVYERKRPNAKSLAQEGLKALRKNKIPVIETASIYREKCVDGVIIKPDKDGSIDDAMFKKGAIYSLCLEIAGKASEEQQFIGALTFLNEVLRNFKEIK
jgi:predicted deacylase